MDWYVQGPVQPAPAASSPSPRSASNGSQPSSCWRARGGVAKSKKMIVCCGEDRIDGQPDDLKHSRGFLLSLWGGRISAEPLGPPAFLSRFSGSQWIKLPGAPGNDISVDDDDFRLLELLCQTTWPTAPRRWTRSSGLI